MARGAARHLHAPQQHARAVGDGEEARAPLCIDGAPEECSKANRKRAASAQQAYLERDRGKRYGVAWGVRRGSACGVARLPLHLATSLRITTTRSGPEKNSSVPLRVIGPDRTMDATDRSRAATRSSWAETTEAVRPAPTEAPPVVAGGGAGGGGS